MRLKQLGIALAQLVNVVCGGYADETISARAWRCAHKAKRWDIAMRVINRIVWWQNNHCRGAWAMEKDRRHLPPAYRDGN